MTVMHVVDPETGLPKAVTEAMLGGGGGSGTDSAGNALPNGFDYLEEDYTYDGSGNIETIVKTSGSDTYTQTWTWTNGKVSNISKWVKS